MKQAQFYCLHNHWFSKSVFLSSGWETTPVWCQQDFTENDERECGEQSDHFVKLCRVASEDEIRRNKAIITTSWEGVEDGANWGMEDCGQTCMHALGMEKKKCQKRASHAVKFLGHGSNRVCHSPWCLQGWSSLTYSSNYLCRKALSKLFIARVT